MIHTRFTTEALMKVATQTARRPAATTDQGSASYWPGRPSPRATPNTEQTPRRAVESNAECWA